jgi:nickel/cobalt transporter (NicO) family protein
MGRSPFDPDRRRRLRGLVVAVACLGAMAARAALPATASAHPLGNFTINHYAGLAIAPDAVDLDIVIDMAEIPAFQERQAMDADGDGSVSDDEGVAWSATACDSLVADLHLARDGAPVTVTPVADAHSVAFPPGAGGLSTLRLVCAYHAPLAAVTAGPTTLTFNDGSYAERIGWREIIATGSSVLLDTHGLPPTSPSQKLTAYPAEMIAQPLDIRSATIGVRPDPAASKGPSPTASAATGHAAAGAGLADPGSAAGPGNDAPVGAVPGGVAGELPAIFQSTNLTPFVLLASLAAAVALGAWHALTPGHGKTLMAAYLVGSRGTAVHAVGLGLSVAVSHTLGIVALAILIIGAQGVLPPDLVVRATPVIAAASVAAIGGWMLLGEVRRRRAAALPSAPHEHEPEHEHDHVDAHPHSHPHDHAHPGEHAAAVDPVDALEHEHGGRRHSHLPPGGSTLSWRGLFVLGLAGGLIPSTSALIILLGSIAAGRPAFGLVLVIAFGLGMAAVMTGVGLLMILARGRLDRMPSRSALGRLATAAPLIASVAVLSLGVVLTWSAVAGRPVL